MECRLRREKRPFKNLVGVSFSQKDWRRRPKPKRKTYKSELSQGGNTRFWPLLLDYAGTRSDN
jgi:hypothetical protein